MGTPAYMAPEQFTHGDAVTQRADLYAFGCCFYEALTGRHIFEFRKTAPIIRALHAHVNEQPLPVLEHAAHCSKELSGIIMRCLEKDPDARWSGVIRLTASPILRASNSDRARKCLPIPMRTFEGLTSLLQKQIPSLLKPNALPHKNPG